MKKIDITGWKNVFWFTFIQTIKTKSYGITLAVICLAIMIGIPIIGYVNYDGSDEKEVSCEQVTIENIDKIYVSYENNESIDKLMETWKARYKCKFEYLAPDKVESVSESFNDEKNSSIIAKIDNNGFYSVNLISGWNTRNMYEEMETVSSGIADDLKELQLKGVIDQSVIDKAVKEVNAYTVGDENADEYYMNKYFIWLSCITIITFIVTFAGQSLATSVVTEKSSKLVEYLLLAVRPMALVTGKMLAALASLLVQIAAILLTGVLSVNVSSGVLGFDVGAVVGNMISGGDISSVFGGVEPLSIIVSLIIMILGVIFFLFIAAIAGASVSKMEEMTEGMVMFTMLVIVGAYMSLALSMGNVFNENGQMSGTLAMVCCLLPISSVFTVPANLMMGSVSVGIALASIVILVISNTLMLIVTSKIYEYLLFYNGVTLKIKDIVYLVRHGRIKEAK